MRAFDVKVDIKESVIRVQKKSSRQYMCARSIPWLLL
jgi:hypothetical protein